MSNALTLKIYPSNTYLILTLVAYFFSILTFWYYSYSPWLSAILSLLTTAWLIYFISRFVQLTHPKSTIKILFDNNTLSITKNTQNTQQYPYFYPAFQSRFLVIIHAGKESIVIFKDATQSQSLSQLNRYLNANT